MQMRTRVASGLPSYPDYLMVLRGQQVLALERSLNPSIPYLHRVAWADSPVTPTAPVAVVGTGQRQVYQVDASVGLPAEADLLRFVTHPVRLVPFADMRDGRV